MHRGIKEVVGGLEQTELHASRQTTLNLAEHLTDVGVHLSGIGTWCLLYIEHHTWFAIQVGAEVIGSRTQLHLGNVSQAKYLALL